eukprot:TRINITY_DN24462_c0_g1_i1.p1 TRINITY_DN24462_c0_g1~~TRINITY_DN24462_c0_g1_i1.p1  ORF type:complete len:488 (-),score=61.30 TRINITY_DN24462_c0_g1_i1:70-1533(-)
MGRTWLGIALLIATTKLVAARGSDDPDVLVWIKECGGSVFPGLRVQKTERSGRGLYTNNTVKPPSSLISLPFKCTLSVDTALQEIPSLAKLQHYIERNQTAKSLVTNGMLLSAFVMMQMRSHHGRFAPYLQDLRRELQSTVMDLPWFWSNAELAQLKGTHMLDILNDYKAMTVAEYKVIMATFPKLRHKYDLGKYIVAASLVNSRNYGDGGQSPPVLLPGVDMTNHFLPKPDSFISTQGTDDFISKAVGATLVRDVNREVYEYRASRIHQQNEEVLHAYGLASNAHFLAMYGFVVPWIHNLTCLAETSLKVPVKNLISKPFAQPWMLTDVTDVISLQLNSYSLNSVDDLLAFARLWSSHTRWADLNTDCGLARSSASTSTDLSKWRLDLSCRHVSREEEVAALGFVQSLIASHRSKMVEGSVQDEEALIADSSVPQRLRAAATIRRDEKHVLNEVEQFVCNAQVQLQQAGSQWRSYLSSLRQGQAPN